MGFLTSEQIETFHKNGLLVVENFLTETEVKDMRKSILDRVKEMNPEEHKAIFSTTSHHQVN